MKALAAMRGPLSFTAVEFSKCQHQTVVDLVDLVGTVSPGAPANQVVQGAQEPSFRVAAMTIGHEGLDRTTTAQPVRAGMMTALGSAGTMIGHVDHVVMMVDRVDPEGTMIVLPVCAVTTTAHGSAGMMIGRVDHVEMMVDPVDPDEMMTVRDSDVMMIGRVDHGVMTADPVDPDGMTSALGSAAMMIVRLVRAGMMTVRDSVVMMIGRVDHVVMTIGDHVVKVAAHLVPARLRNRRQMKSVIGVVVAG